MTSKWIGLIGASAVAAFVAGALDAPPSQAAERTPHRQRHRSGDATLPMPTASGTRLGDPLPDLDAVQRAVFAVGREEFQSLEEPDEGLGPIFNAAGCAACHFTPVIGGASAIVETRFGRLDNGRFDPLVEKGGSLLQTDAIDPELLEQIPPEANVTAGRLTTPLFGVGLIEAIPDADIELNAQRHDVDGIRGRVARVRDVVSGKPRVGRFGWKAQHATVLAFAADAYVNELGITSRFFPEDNAPNGKRDLLDKHDKLVDPEDTVDAATGEGDIDASAHFIRLLAAPPVQRMSADAVAGQRVFEQAQCAACHRPVMYTGTNAIASLSNQTVRLFSDLLLHDMGRLGDGIEQGDAGQREMRTAPLWGLAARKPYLHDGRAANVTEAIRAHDGEGAGARQLFESLSDDQRQQLLAFLDSI